MISAEYPPSFRFGNLGLMDHVVRLIWGTFWSASVNEGVNIRSSLVLLACLVMVGSVCSDHWVETTRWLVECQDHQA